MLQKIKSLFTKQEMVPPWVEIARREIGVKEFKGGENPRILEYFKATTLHATEDEVSWCSAFMNWVMQQCGMERSHSAAARSWLGYGTRLPGYKQFCIVVFKRGNSPWQGHVAIAMDDYGKSLRVLGGNQSDMVSYKVMPKDQVLGYIWPKPEQEKINAV